METEEISETLGFSSTLTQVITQEDFSTILLFPLAVVNVKLPELLSTTDH
jgi:hypothetical protein